MKKRAIYTAFLLLLTFTAAFGQQTNVHAVLDTSKMRIGEQARIDLYLQVENRNAAQQIRWPAVADTLASKVEVVSVSPIDTTFPDKANPSVMLQHQQITISIYDSGYFAIPAFRFVMNNDSANALTTNPLF